MTATAHRRTRIPASERRDQVARAAGALFARHGYAGTRLDDVAAAAGVTKPIVYRHFASKKELYMSLLVKHEHDLPTFFELAAAAPDDSPAAVVRAILDGWLDYVRENSHAWIMLFRDSSGDEDIRALRLRVTARARELLAAFVAEGGGVPDEEVVPTAELLTSGLAGLALWWIDHPDTPKQVVLETAARISQAAIGGRE